MAFLSARFSLFLQTEEMFWRGQRLPTLPLSSLGGYTTPCPVEEAPGGFHWVACLHVRSPLRQESCCRPGNTYFQSPWPRELCWVCGFFVTGPFRHHPPSCPRYGSTVVAQHLQKGTRLVFPFSVLGPGQKQQLLPQQPSHLCQQASAVRTRCLRDTHLLPSPPLPSRPALT